MDTYSAQHAPAAFLVQVATGLHVAGTALGRLARTIDARLAARRAAAEARRSIAHLSDRDLRDIGLTRFDVLRG